jgi:CheY-like chemotaxis protein
MNRARILLVEDNQGDVLLLGEALAAGTWNPAVQAVANGRAALAWLGRDRPDLIVLDLNLPDLAGVEILAALKGDSSLASIPVVVLSGSPWEWRQAKALGLSEGHYLLKPDSFCGFLGIAAQLESLWKQSGA